MRIRVRVFILGFVFVCLAAVSAYAQQKSGANDTSPQETSSKPPESPGDKAQTRDYWQGKFKAARQELAHAKELQQLAEDELHLLQTRQAQEIDANAKADLTTKVQAKQSEIATNKATTEAAQKALDDLEKEFKDSGAPDDWSQTDANDTSLGDIARQLKAQKADEHKPAREITNDDIASPKEDASSSKGKSSADSAPEGSGGPAQAHDEKYFRSRLSKLQDQLDTHKRELEVLQEKLGQNQMQYYPDPNKALQQQYSRDDINKLRADIDAKKQQVADDEKAIEDLRDQLRHEGGDPSWLR
jgi:hypothetical protein